MNLFSISSAPAASRDRSRQAFTLIEAMFALGTLVMLIMALLGAHLMGLRLDQLVESKAGASDTSRRVLNQLPVDIRSAKMWNIGNLSGTNVTAVSDGTAQSGNALQLFETTNGSQYILYYFDLSDSAAGDGKLMRTTSTNWNPACIASNLVNWLGGGYSFAAENYNGVVATNRGSSKAYKNLIHTVLQFCQFQYPLTPVGTNGLYDFYKVEFRATPHLPE
jgi:hypothetical protein